MASSLLNPWLYLALGYTWRRDARVVDLVAKLCPTLCDPMDCSTPGFSILHYLPGLAQLMCIGLMMPCNYLILCHPLPLLPSIFSNIRVCFSKWALLIRWPKYWSLNFSISPEGFSIVNEAEVNIFLEFPWITMIQQMVHSLAVYSLVVPGPRMWRLVKRHWPWKWLVVFWQGMERSWIPSIGLEHGTQTGSWWPYALDLLDSPPSGDECGP